jgi:hypothetical protein
MTSPMPRRCYVQSVLDLYRLAPGTTGHLRRSDRQLAGELHDRGISVELVRAALLLAIARRTFRSASAPPLAPIATLHYIQPVIDELLAAPPDPGYVSYIRCKLSAIAPNFAAATAHQLSWSPSHRLS